MMEAEDYHDMMVSTYQSMQCIIIIIIITIRGMFNDAVSSSDYMAPNDPMTVDKEVETTRDQWSRSNLTHYTNTCLA
jgi:hypothetical protein